MEFYTIITDAGRAAVADAIATGGKVDLVQLAAGDGGGQAVQPVPSQQALAGEVWRGELSTYTVDGDVLTLSSFIPAEAMAFTLREMGVFTADGMLFAVCNTPEIRHVPPEEGVVGDLTLGMQLKISTLEQDALTIQTNPDLDFIPNREKGAAGGVAPLGPDGKVPKEYLGVKGYQVGDILTTVRTDLDDSWLLCNGAVVDRDGFPQLSELLSSKFDVPWTVITGSILSAIRQDGYSINSLQSFCGFLYLQGKYVVAGMFHYDGTSSTVWKTAHFVAVSEDLSGPWNIRYLWSYGPNPNSYDYADIFDQINGYFVFGGYTRVMSDDYEEAHIWSCPVDEFFSNVSGSSWTKSPVLWSGNYSNTIAVGVRKIKYINGKYVAVGYRWDTSSESSSEAILAYGDSLDGTWTTKVIWTGLSTIARLNDVVELNGIYAVIGNGPSTNVQSVAYASGLDSEEWIIQQASSSSQADYGRLLCYGDHIVTVDHNGYNLYFGKLNPVDGTLQKVTVSMSYSDGIFSYTTVSGRISNVLILDDRFTFAAYQHRNEIITSENQDITRVYSIDTAELFRKDKASVNINDDGLAWMGNVADASDSMPQITYPWMVFRAEDHAYDVLGYYTSDIIATMDANQMRLPELSTDRAYSYIKAKEDTDT